jgi:hypothetical protein
MVARPGWQEVDIYKLKTLHNNKHNNNNWERIQKGNDQSAALRAFFAARRMHSTQSLVLFDRQKSYLISHYYGRKTHAGVMIII